MTAEISRVELYLSDARKAAADGLTWAEFGELLVAFLKIAMAMYDEVASMTGEQKKAAVLAGVGRLFDVAADNCIPLVLWPVWGLARGPVRLLVLALASGAIEQLLPLVRVR